MTYLILFIHLSLQVHKNDIKQLSERIVNNCEMPDFSITKKRNNNVMAHLGLVFKLKTITDDGKIDEWSPCRIFESMPVWPISKLDMPMTFDEQMNNVIQSLGTAVYQFLMYFQPFNEANDRFYPA